MADGTSLRVPEHVPSDLVRSFPFSFAAYTTENPFDHMVAEVHEGPPIFYVPALYAGGDGVIEIP